MIFLSNIVKQTVTRIPFVCPITGPQQKTSQESSETTRPCTHSNKKRNVWKGNVPPKITVVGFHVLWKVPQAINEAILRLHAKLPFSSPRTSSQSCSFSLVNGVEMIPQQTVVTKSTRPLPMLPELRPPSLHPPTGPTNPASLAFKWPEFRFQMLLPLE